MGLSESQESTRRRNLSPQASEEQQRNGCHQGPSYELPPPARAPTVSDATQTTFGSSKRPTPPGRNLNLLFPTSRQTQPARVQDRLPLLCHGGMDTQTLHEALDTFSEVASHIKYAVCGRAAAVWGFSDIRSTRIELLCPKHSCETMKAWASIQGMYLYPYLRRHWSSDRRTETSAASSSIS